MALMGDNGPFRIRVKSENHKDTWLHSIDVFGGNKPIQVPNWEWMFRVRSHYRFVANLIESESKAHRFSFRKIAEIQKQILAEQQIEAEIVACAASI
jgi:hypothetical protein